MIPKQYRIMQFVYLYGIFLCGLVSLCLADRFLQCLVCKKLTEEITHAIESVDPKKKLDIGYRIDDAQQQKIPYARSSVHLTDVLETVCDTFKDYAQVTYKSNGRRGIMKLVGADGKMNPEFAKVDAIPDKDINAKLKHYCLGIVDEFEEEIMKLYKKETDDVIEPLCVDAAGLCEKRKRKKKKTEL